MSTTFHSNDNHFQITVANIRLSKAVPSTVKTFVGKVFCIMVIDANHMYVSMYIICSWKVLSREIKNNLKSLS